MLQSLINNLNQDIAVLQLRINLGKDVGFNDMARLLESMLITCFKALDIANLKSKRQIQVNFPAIDSADDDKDGGIALQVTSLADANKIKDTITAFEKPDASGKSLKDQYKKLYILGFCKASKTKKIPAYCEVIDPSYLTDLLIDTDSEEIIQKVLNSIRQHNDYSSLHPYQDVSCLHIMLSYIGRNAVRHPMHCEGNVRDMTKGLNEISELIGRGSVGGRTKSKAMNDFQDPVMKKFLVGVLDTIGKITAIVYSASRDDGFVFLNSNQKDAIDKHKQAISKAAIKIATKYSIDMPLDMHHADE